MAANKQHTYMVLVIRFAAIFTELSLAYDFFFSFSAIIARRRAVTPSTITSLLPTSH